jgi:hypothetical protein
MESLNTDIPTNKEIVFKFYKNKIKDTLIDK